MTASRMDPYADKIAVITGPRRGVGRIVAEHFLNAGATVVGLARGEQTFEHSRYTHLHADISKPEEVQAAFRTVSAQFPTVHIVVNNAGVFKSQHSMIKSAGRAQEMVETNILGAFHVSREAARIMRKSRYGRIINIGSIAVRMEPVG